MTRMEPITELGEILAGGRLMHLPLRQSSCRPILCDGGETRVHLVDLTGQSADAGTGWGNQQGIRVGILGWPPATRSVLPTTGRCGSSLPPFIGRSLETRPSLESLV